MSGQCLSSGGGGHALTPPRDLRLGEPLPPQPANLTSAAPPADSHLCHTTASSQWVIGHYLQFPEAIPVWEVRSDALLPRLPLSRLTPQQAALSVDPARLACLIHAANVRSEPGSNPSIVSMTKPAQPPKESARSPVKSHRLQTAFTQQHAQVACPPPRKETTQTGREHASYNRQKLKKSQTRNVQ